MVGALGGWKRLVIIAAVAIVFFVGGRGVGWALVRRQQAQRQHAVRKLVTELGGHCYYDFQLEPGAQQTLADDDNLHSRPHWASKIFGKDFIHEIFYVSLAQFQEYRSDGAVAAARAEIGDQQLAEILQLRGLRWLALTGTAVTDEGVKAIAQLPHLEKLWLSQTQVTDKSLAYLSGCQHLLHLSVEATATTDAGVREIAKMSKLEVLSLGSPTITADGLAQLSNLTSLKEVYLDRLPVDMRSLAAISRLRELQVVSLRHTPVTDAGIVRLGSLPRLSRLLLDGTSISDDALTMARWPELIEFSARGTRLTDAGLEKLAHCRRLQSLKLDGTRCTLAGLHRLLVDKQSRSWEPALAVAFNNRQDDQGRTISLDMTGFRIRDADICHLAELRELQWLIMPDSELTDVGIQALVDARLDKLTLLNINRSTITEAGLRLLAKLKSLRTLHVAGTALSTDALSAVEKESPTLRIYTSDLTHHALRGTGKR